MTEIEFGIPGEVAFSYVHIKGTPEELGRVNYEMLGALFTSAMFSHKQAEKAAIERLRNGETALLPASQVPEVQDVPEDAERLLKEELGATAVSSGADREEMEAASHDAAEAPYKAAPPAAVKSKPWETSKPAPQVRVRLENW